MAEEKTTSHFSRELKRLRDAAGLTLQALAHRAGLSKQALSHLELGTREPTWETVQRLAIALGVSCETFNDPDLKQEVMGEAAQASLPPEQSAEAKRKKTARKKGKRKEN